MIMIIIMMIVIMIMIMIMVIMMIIMRITMRILFWGHRYSTLKEENNDTVGQFLMMIYM